MIHATYLKKRSRHLFALTLYIGFALLVTHPIAWQLGTAVPGSEGDVWIHLWTFNWVKQALLSGQSPFFTTLIFFPQGASLLTHNFAWLHIALWLPLQALVGAGAAYSLLFLATFAFNGFTTYLFALEHNLSQWAAFVSGLIVAFWPYTLSHHDHPNLIVIGWIPLVLLYLHRTLHRQRWQDIVWTAVYLALLGYTRWQLLFFALPLIGLYLLYELRACPSMQRRSQTRSLLVITAITLLLLLPIFWIMIRSAQIPAFDPHVVDETFSQTDLLSYLIPSRYHPWWGTAVFNTLYANLHNSSVFNAFIGYTTLGLLLYGWRQQWPQKRLWLLIALFYLLLALGPQLLVNGRSLLPLPYALLKNTLVDAIIRRPARFNIMLSLPIALLAGQGIKRLWQRHPRHARLVTLGCIALILLEYRVTYPTLALQTPAWYRQLAQEPGNFGILELPMHNRVYDEQYLYYQLTHGKPLVGGHVSRPPTAVFAFIRSLNMLNHIPDHQDPPANVPNVGGQLSQLAQANVRYLVLHKKLLGAENLQKWQTWLALAPAYEDDELVVYQTAVRVGYDTPWQPTGVSGLGIVTKEVEETAVTQNSTLNLHLRWGSQSRLSNDYLVCFTLRDSTHTPRQRTCRPISAAYPTSRWPANELFDAHYQFALSPYLPSDSYQLTAEVTPNTPISLVSFPLNIRSRTFSNNSRRPICLSWDGRIALYNYTIIQPNNNTLAVQFIWQSQKRMTTSYTLFVHLVNKQTGKIVTQTDTFPDNGSYPTTWWERGELIPDTISLPMSHVPPGIYQIRLGWYDAASGKRLPITMLTCPLASISNQSLLLQTVEWK